MGIIRFFAQYRHRFIKAATGVTALGSVAVPVENTQINVIKRVANNRRSNGAGQFSVIQPVAKAVFGKIAYQQRMQGDGTLFIVRSMDGLLAQQFRRGLCFQYLRAKTQVGYCAFWGKYRRHVAAINQRCGELSLYILLLFVVLAEF